MSFIKPDKTEQKKEEINHDFDTFNCTICGFQTIRKEMAAYGARCWRCYDNYCKEAPRYQPQPQFTGDSRDWARRILHKEQNGESVSKVAVQFAKEALRIN